MVNPISNPMVDVVTHPARYSYTLIEGEKYFTLPSVFGDTSELYKAIRLFDVEVVGISNGFHTSDELSDVGVVKILAKISQSFYHVVMQDLPYILDTVRKNPGAIVVLFTSRSGHIDRNGYSAGDIFAQAVEKILISRGVRVVILPKMETLYLKMANFIIQEEEPYPTYHSITEVSNEFVRYCAKFGLVEKPYRKIYVSRRDVGFRAPHLTEDVIINTDYVKYVDDQRIDDPDTLEEYFRGHGFEIVCPTSDGLTFDEQLEIMREAKLLVGLTGSGLTNLVMMQDGQTVVELQTDVIGVEEVDGGDGVRELYQYAPIQYPKMCIPKGHNYVMVPHRRNALEIIDKFENLQYLKAVLDI